MSTLEMDGFRTSLPVKGFAKDAILEQMKSAREQDMKWQDGRVFGLVYHAGEEVNDLLKQAYSMFFSENGLNPSVFPSLRRFETEVVAMTAELLGGDENTVGNMTSGGTESILLSVQSARDWGRAHRTLTGIPEIVLPVTAHPAFDKAAHYFGLKVIHIPVTSDLRADVEAARAAVNHNTVLLVASAPSYPHGVVDPVPELAGLARQHGLLFHVDACMGGFMLPFVRKLGYPVPDFDLRVPGVSSISADLHKYGYAAKGTSVLLYRDSRVRRHQFFAQTDWPGGIYASPTMSGTRPGGAIASAWAVMNYLGEDGYLKIAVEVMSAVAKIRGAVQQIPDLYILGDPVMSVMALASRRLDIYTLGDEMSLRGWHLDRQQFPPSLHLTINHAHVHNIERFISDLQASQNVAGRRSIQRVGSSLALRFVRGVARRLPERLLSRLTAWASRRFAGDLPGPASRSAAMYGMMGALPNRGDIRELVLDLVEQFTKVQTTGG